MSQRTYLTISRIEDLSIIEALLKEAIKTAKDDYCDEKTALYYKDIYNRLLSDTNQVIENYLHCAAAMDTLLRSKQQ